MTYRTITKRQARERWAAGEEIVLCGSKMRPGPPWHPECFLTPDGVRDFEAAYAAWAFYNTSDEEGHRARYYIAEGSGVVA